MFVGVPQPKPMSVFSPNFQDMFTPKESNGKLGMPRKACLRNFGLVLKTCHIFSVK